MDNKDKYNVIKEITKALRKNFKGIQSNAYGYCCTSDYDTYHKYTNNDDYVCAKIYKGGSNNQYYDREFEIGDYVCFMWNLTNFKVLEVLSVMGNVARQYGCSIIAPPNEGKCIELAFV